MTEIQKLLKSHDLRVTTVRQQLLTLFIESDVALSNQDIEAQLENIDRITLYRTLKSFQEKGIIHKAHDGTGITRYASCSSGCSTHAHHDEHVHFHCTKCDNTFCVDEIKVPHIDLPNQFVAEKLNVIVEGTCEKCS